MFHWEPEGHYHCTMSTAIAPFWFSMEHLWIVIAPLWLSTDDMWEYIRIQLMCCSRSSFVSLRQRLGSILIIAKKQICFLSMFLSVSVVIAYRHLKVIYRNSIIKCLLEGFMLLTCYNIDWYKLACLQCALTAKPRVSCSHLSANDIWPHLQEVRTPVKLVATK